MKEEILYVLKMTSALTAMDIAERIRAADLTAVIRMLNALRTDGDVKADHLAGQGNTLFYSLAKPEPAPQAGKAPARQSRSRKPSAAPSEAEAPVQLAKFVPKPKGMTTRRPPNTPASILGYKAARDGAHITLYLTRRVNGYSLSIAVASLKRLLGAIAEQEAEFDSRK